MPEIVSHEDWIAARVAHLAEEKEFNQKRDALAAKRRELPWVEVEEDYVFEGANGGIKMSDLFAGKSQLIIYHFMYGDDWEEGCPSCSFWADNFSGIAPHLAARDASFAVISHAPYGQLASYQKRMGWGFNWLSSNGNSFNSDYNVSFSDAEFEDGSAIYNYKKSTFPSKEAPGISVFLKDDAGDDSSKIYHTYSTFARGLDMLNGAYHYMDLLPKGRDEDALDYPQAWIRRHDQY